MKASHSLNNLLKLFLSEKIDFVIVGGFAGVVYGSSMVTKDLDLCFLLTPENILKLRQVLQPYNPKLRITPKKLPFLEYPKDISKLKNLYLETDLGIVDLISNITGVGDFQRVASHAKTIELFGYTCKVIALEDLIEAKTALGREKDLAMVKELKVIQERLQKK